MKYVRFQQKNMYSETIPEKDFALILHTNEVAGVEIGYTHDKLMGLVGPNIVGVVSRYRAGEKLNQYEANQLRGYLVIQEALRGNQECVDTIRRAVQKAHGHILDQKRASA